MNNILAVRHRHLAELVRSGVREKWDGIIEQLRAVCLSGGIVGLLEKRKEKNSLPV